MRALVVTVVSMVLIASLLSGPLGTRLNLSGRSAIAAAQWVDEPDRMIDLYGGAINNGYGMLPFPAPYGGQGLNVSMDMVFPQSWIELFANVTYNRMPVSSKLVSFEVVTPNGTSFTKLFAFTDENGVATVGFRMPWPSLDPESLIGVWNVTSEVSVADVVVSDSMPFAYDYLINMDQVTTTKFRFNEHVETVPINVYYHSYSQQAYSLLFSASIKDELEVSVGYTNLTATVQNASPLEPKQYVATLGVKLPEWAYPGIAHIRVNAFDKDPSYGGVPVTPEFTPYPVIQIIHTSVPDDYATIQKAVNFAFPGDAIFVRNGTYFENVVVNNTVLLVGRDKETTFVDGRNLGPAFSVVSSGGSITGFTLKQSGGNDANGLAFLSANGTEFRGNIIENCSTGILLNASFNNTFSDNVVRDNADDGVSLGNSSSANRLLNNSLIDNRGTGLVIENGSSGNVITWNVLSGNADGIRVDSSSSNVFSGNQVLCSNLTSDSKGLEISGDSSENVVKENLFEGNSLAVDASSLTGNGNAIYHNNFFDNEVEVHCSNLSADYWDAGYPDGGNFWSHYVGVDLYSGLFQNETGSDGFGDQPYVFADNDADNFPLMKPYPWNSCDVAVTYVGRVDAGKIAEMKNVVGRGALFLMDVFVLNYGSSAESLNVTVYANGTVVDSALDVQLSGRNSTILHLFWNTTGFGFGNYRIDVSVEPLVGEVDVVDNVRSVWVALTVIGDVNGDGIVDMKDIGYAAVRFDRVFGEPLWNSNVDINEDWFIDMRDIATIAKHFSDSVNPDVEP